MKEYRNKEEILVVFLASSLRLNKYDNKFLNNLALLLSKNRYITTNQNTLFDKLLVKYKKQLSKHHVNVNEALQLQWNTKLIESAKEFTEAYLSLHNDLIKLSVPFNKKLIEIIRNQNCSLKWHSTDKCYYSQFRTDTIKIITTIIPNFYVLNISVELQLMLDNVKAYDNARFYDPTLVNIKDRYYLLCSNEHLHNAVSNIPFNNNPKNLCTLGTYGITIDESVTNNDEFLCFASNYNPVINIDDLDELAFYLKELEIKNIICNYRIARIKSIRTEIENIFSEQFNIYYGKLIFNKKDYSGKSVYFYYGSSDLSLSYFGYDLQKVIRIVNNRAVQLQ